MKQNFLRIIPLILGLFTSLQAMDMDNSMDVEIKSKKREREIFVIEVDVQNKSYNKKPKISEGCIFDDLPVDLTNYITSMIIYPYEMSKDTLFFGLNPAKMLLLFKMHCSKKKYSFNQSPRLSLSFYDHPQKANHYTIDTKLYQLLCDNQHVNDALKCLFETAKMCDRTIPLKIKWVCDGFRNFETNMTLICDYFNQISSLDLRDNDIDFDGYSRMLDLLGDNTSVTSLDVSGSHIGLEQIDKIGHMLEKNATLTHLGLYIDCYGWNKNFFKGLKENKTLTSLVIWGQVYIEMVLKVIDLLKENTTLTSLILNSRGVGSYGQISFRDEVAWGNLRNVEKEVKDNADIALLRRKGYTIDMVSGFRGDYANFQISILKSVGFVESMDETGGGA